MTPASIGSLRLEKGNEFDSSARNRLSCGEGENLKDETLAQLLSEVAWIWDTSGIESVPTYKRGFSVSEHPQFLSLAGFVETGFFQATRGIENLNQTRRLDPNEVNSPTNFFVVNFSKFLMDKTYPCRRPAMDYFLSSLWGLNHETRVQGCPLNTLVALHSLEGGGSFGGGRFEKLDASRIYAIHILHAGSGEGIMSGWGHTSFRLIVCAPHRKEVSFQCLFDLDSHLVLSFAAPILDSHINPWKGLTGGYASTLHIQPFFEFEKLYTQIEDRPLFSLPLLINSPEHIRMFVYRVLEYYWEYDGRYYFLTNNCAVESMNFLKSVFFESPLHALNPITPWGVLESLERARVLSSIGIDWIEQPSLHRGFQEWGFYFPKKGDLVVQRFNKIKKWVETKKFNSVFFPWNSVERFRSESNATGRRGLYEALKLEGLNENWVLTFSGLEEDFWERKYFQFRQKLGMALFKILEASGGEGPDLYKEALSLTLYPRNHAVQSLNGYGIPVTNRDFPVTEIQGEEFFVNQVRSQDEEFKKILTHQELSAFLKRTFAAEIAELKEIHKNRVLFFGEVREFFIQSSEPSEPSASSVFVFPSTPK